MSLVDSGSLAVTAERINHAHFFGETISKRDALEARRFIVSRYGRQIPQRILDSARPDPRWATIPASFNLTDAERRSKPKTFTGEALANAALRMVHSREAARALFVLAALLDESVREALALCGSIRETADRLKASGSALYCCGSCTVSVWRLAGIGAPAVAGPALEHLLSALPRHRDGNGAWRRFPFFYTLLALSDLDHPRAVAELAYARPACAKKRKGLEPVNAIAARRIAVLERVLDRTA